MQISKDGWLAGAFGALLVLFSLLRGADEISIRRIFKVLWI